MARQRKVRQFDAHVWAWAEWRVARIYARATAQAMQDFLEQG